MGYGGPFLCAHSQRISARHRHRGVFGCHQRWARHYQGFAGTFFQRCKEHSGGQLHHFGAYLGRKQHTFRSDKLFDGPADPLYQRATGVYADGQKAFGDGESVSHRFAEKALCYLHSRSVAVLFRRMQAWIGAMLEERHRS